jgi:hypothetical protein
VQKNKYQKGEIFGLDNLLSFHAEDIFLRDIVNKTNIAEARKGVQMIELSMEDALNDEDDPLRVDDDDDGDGAMSQLAALLTKGDQPQERRVKSRPKADPIMAILSSAGVEYTHENSEVIGSSRVEEHLSRRAEETGNDVEIGEQRLFAETGSTIPGGIEYQFHPSGDVMVRQFCTMAKTFGFADATEFALVVEGWTQKQRTDCLERFYLKRKERTADQEMEIERSNHVRALGDRPEQDDEEEDDDDDEL